MLLSALCISAVAGIGAPPANRPYRVSADLREVSNLKTFTKVLPLSKAHRAALAKNLFFTSPSNDAALYWTYGRNDYANLPSIVTADNVLQLGHIFFDATLRLLEQGKLLADLESMTRSMLKDSVAKWRSLGGTPLEGPALRNVAYFGVAARLLEVEADVPDSARRMVSQELAKIKEHAGFSPSAIFPYDLDYSQFIVRGHYTKSETLKRYFGAMMWYGLVPFAVERIRNLVPEPATETVQQALLLARGLRDSKSIEAWNRIYGATALYAGKSNSLTPSEWTLAAAPIFGETGSLSAYADSEKVLRFVAAVKRLREPAIVAKRTRGSVPGPVQFRMMGQRAIPDSRILQELSDPQRRPFPSPLDVMAVLGSPRAAAILDGSKALYNPGNWPGYLPKRKQLSAEFAKLSLPDWKRDLYWSWLSALKSLLRAVPAGYPSFMRNDAWADKSLVGALASWAELRHDTILYGQQSVAEMGGEDEPPPPPLKGYVEPNVTVYRAIEGLIRQLESGLKSRGYLSAEVAKQVADFRDLIGFLIRVSEKELANRPLAKAEHKRIRYIEGDLEGLHLSMEYAANNHRQLSNDDLDMALIADVHSAFGQALEVAVGRADHLVAVVPIEGKLVLARGTAFTYFEFLQPMGNRLTDEAWRKQLGEGKAPKRPKWATSYHVPVPLKGKDE